MKKFKIRIHRLLTLTRILPFITTVQVLGIIIKDLGHFKSSTKQQSINNMNDPIPWFTYPAIEYLDSLDISKKTVFEFGSGNSTIYFTNRAYKVTATEHNIIWFKKISTILGNFNKTKIVFRPIKKDYINSIIEDKSKYDIIVIDGEHRDECSLVACRKLNKGGIIILDNSDWFPNICESLRKAGLIEIDFTGFGPINPYITTTTFFIEKSFNYKFKHLKHHGSINPVF